MLRDLGGRVAWNPATGTPYTRTPWEQGRADRIREATCEQARHMQNTGEDTDGTPFAGGSFGPLTLEGADGGAGDGSDPRFSANARDILIAAGLSSSRVRG
jgi:hypothetical protein